MEGHAQGKVPFAWENKPGISKHAIQDCPTNHVEQVFTAIKLPPPPCSALEQKSTARVSLHELQQVPLPPCAFQPPLISLSKRGLRNVKHHEDDPFFSAYKECTKSIQKGKKGRRKLFDFSCKNSCSVREDANLVKVSQLPYSFSEKKDGERYMASLKMKF